MVFVTRYSVVGDRVSQPAVFALGLRSVLLSDRPTLVRPLAGGQPVVWLVGGVEGQRHISLSGGGHIFPWLPSVVGG